MLGPRWFFRRGMLSCGNQFYRSGPLRPTSKWIRPQKHICVNLPRVDRTFAVTFHGRTCTGPRLACRMFWQVFWWPHDLPDMNDMGKQRVVLLGEAVSWHPVRSLVAATWARWGIQIGWLSKADWVCWIDSCLGSWVWYPLDCSFRLVLFTIEWHNMCWFEPACSNSKWSFLLMNAKTSQTTWYKKVQPLSTLQIDSTCMLPRSRSRGPGLSSDVIAGGVLSSASAAAAPVAAQPADRCCSLWEFERPFGAVCGSWVCIPEPPKGQWRSSKCDQTNILIYWYVQPILVLGQDFSMRFRWQERSADRRTCQKSS